MSRRAIYPGSFDPITNGHLDILERGLTLFDHIIVAVAHNLRKSPMFSAERRVALIREAVGEEPRVSVETFDGLLVDYARRQGAVAVLRGLRALSDFEFEFQMACMNRRLAHEIQAVFLMSGEEYFYVSSSLVKEVSSLGGDVQAHVPPCVSDALIASRREQG